MAGSIHAGHRERMRYKMMHNASKQLLEHELLEILLFYALPRRDTNELAHRLLNEFGTVRRMFDADPRSLMAVKGISEKTVAFIKLFPELFQLYYKAEHTPSTDVSTMLLLKCYAEPLVRYLFTEALIVVHINKKGEAISYDALSMGDTHSVLTSIDKILISAQRKGTHQIALIHNHPHSHCAPSEDDIKSTIKIKYMLSHLDIELCDHIIFGLDGYCSISEIVDAEYVRLLNQIDLHNATFKNFNKLDVWRDMNSPYDAEIQKRMESLSFDNLVKKLQDAEERKQEEARQAAQGESNNIAQEESQTLQSEMQQAAKNESNQTAQNELRQTTQNEKSKATQGETFQTAQDETYQTAQGKLRAKSQDEFSRTTRDETYQSMQYRLCKSTQEESRQSTEDKLRRAAEMRLRKMSQDTTHLTLQDRLRQAAHDRLIEMARTKLHQESNKNNDNNNNNNNQDNNKSNQHKD